MSRAVLVTMLLLLLVIPGVALGATVSGLTITVYMDGKALANATVELWYNGTMAFRGVTDANGTVSFANLTTGNYTIYVYYAGKVYTFEKTIDGNTTTLALNITSSSTDEARLANIWNTIRSNNYYLAGAVAAGFVFLILIAYALSGARVPHRRR